MFVQIIFTLFFRIFIITRS